MECLCSGSLLSSLLTSPCVNTCNVGQYHAISCEFPPIEIPSVTLTSPNFFIIVPTMPISDTVWKYSFMYSLVICFVLTFGSRIQEKSFTKSLLNSRRTDKRLLWRLNEHHYLIISFENQSNSVVLDFFLWCEFYLYKFTFV